MILRAWWPLGLLAVFLALRIGLDAWWLWEFRYGYLFNTDDVGYLTIALDDTQGLKTGGIAGLWRAFLDNRSQAPLVPLLTVPIHLAFGEDIFPSSFVQTPFLVLLALATYGLASRLANAPLVLLAAVVVTSIPEMTDWARAFHFGVPSAALFTAGTYAIIRSEGFINPRWALLNVRISLEFVGLLPITVDPKRQGRIPREPQICRSAFDGSSPSGARTGALPVDTTCRNASTSFGAATRNE